MTEPPSSRLLPVLLDTLIRTCGTVEVGRQEYLDIPRACDLAPMIEQLADLIEERGRRMLDIDPGETSDWLRSQVNLSASNSTQASPSATDDSHARTPQGLKSASDIRVDLSSLSDRGLLGDGHPVPPPAAAAVGRPQQVCPVERSQGIDIAASAKPCPYCGSDDLLIGVGPQEKGGFPLYVYCAGCGAQGPWAYTRDPIATPSIDVVAQQTGWNNRAGVKG